MSSPKSPPPRIEGFTYVEGIGGGGFADVFLYTQHSTGRGVAVKVLRAEHLSDQSLRQFETEARVMAGVSTHPYIVTIHDAGIATDGRPYLVMEHYPQPHFGRRASGGHLPLSEVLRVGVHVSSAVETAHRAGILHRDIKPANILTSTYGDPGLTDFGIAGVQTDEGMSAATGVSYGFSAPEVVLDERSTGAVSSDVYALGATIYALLTGRSPVYVPGGDNSTATLARRVSSGEIQPIRRSDLPRSMEHLVGAMLSGDPATRPGTAADLAAALRDIEQELRLPPTPLMLTGAAGSSTAATPRHRLPPSPDAADGTRRKPRVVDIDGGAGVVDRVPTTFRAAATPSGRVRIPPAPAGPPPSGGSASPDPDAVLGSTVRRAPTATPRTADQAPETIARRTPASPGHSGYSAVSNGAEKDAGRPLTGPILAGAAVVVMLGVLAFLFIGSDSTKSEETTPTRPSTIPATADYVSAPVDVLMAPNPDRSVTVIWSPPAEIEAAAAITYRVFRSDAGHENDPDLAVVRSLSAEIGPELLGQTDAAQQLCVIVQAQLGSAAENSDEECIEMPPASVPEGEVTP